MYLAEVTRPFAEVLAGLIGDEGRIVVATSEPPAAEVIEHLQRRGLDEWEDHIENELSLDVEIPDTQRTALVKARRGQGIYKKNVQRIERVCRITRVDNPVHLVGSHIKPWRHPGNDERLDGENGLLLTPSIDHLFDRGFISFEGNGDMVLSPRGTVCPCVEWACRWSKASTSVGSLPGSECTWSSTGIRCSYGPGSGVDQRFPRPVELYPSSATAAGSARPSRGGVMHYRRYWVIG